MSETKRNHYLSQCISKNFITEQNQMFWEYDCLSGNIRSKNINKLFSGMRLWNQDLEDSISINMENKLSGDLRRLSQMEISNNIIPGRNGLVTPQFYGVVIEDQLVLERISKLSLQIVLVQRMNAKEKNADIESNLKKIYSIDFMFQMPAILMEINPLVLSPPLILIDGMLFTFFVPKVDALKNICGHFCFLFPISTKRFIIWGNYQDMLYFCKKYQNINYLNLCRIDEQGKRCKIASQNEKYLKLLIPQIERFKLGETNVKIEATREWQ